MSAMSTSAAHSTAALYHLLFYSGGLFHLAVITLLPSAALYRTWSIVNTIQPSRDRYIELLTRVAWPHAHWFVTVLVYLTPFWYMVYPPAVPDREELLGRRGDDGARYPTREAQRARWGYWREIGLSWGFHLVLVWTGVVVWGSSWI